jgi:hypothetical protein
MPLLQILTDPQNFRFYAGGRGHVSNAGAFGQKSIPYGNDTKGGGSSNQPYIKSPIPDGFTSNYSDFLLRGGALTNPQISAQDVSRLTQMFTDTKSTNGVFFVTKQELLSQSAVRTQTSGIINEGLYNPLGTLAQAAGVSLGTHLNKQGDPSLPTGAYANNDKLYFTRVSPNVNDPGGSTRSNRLVQLLNGTLVGNNAEGPDPQGSYIMRYTGGPGSIRGVGYTTLRIGRDSKTFLTNQRTQVLGSAYSQNTFTFDSFLLRNVSTDTSLSNPTNPNFPSNFDSLSPAEAEAVLAQENQEPNLVPVTNKDQIASPKYQDFRKILRSKLGTQAAKNASNSGATPDTPEYQTKNYEQNFGFNDPGQRAGKSYVSYTKGVQYTDGSGNPTTLVGAVDKINAFPIYRSEQASKADELNDFVSFRIAAIDNNDPAFKHFMNFRALLDSFSDSYSADWGSVKYLGRGENFYNYNGFTRSVTLAFTVAAQSKQELIPMYKKLNYLASNLTPDYSPNGYMRGPLVQLTVGGYLYEQPGFITDLSYDMITDAPWEIGIDDAGNVDTTVKQLSQMVKVTSFTFIPIHTFAPQKQGLGFSINGLNDTQDVQRYIALEDANNTNYSRAASTNLPPRSLNPINVTPPQPGTVRRTQALPPLPDYTLPVQRTDFL